MKKYIVLLALCLLTAGCAKQEPPATEPPATAAATTQPTEPEVTVPETTAPKTTPVQVMGDNIPVIRRLLQQGETMEVTGYDGSFAKVKGEGRVETQFLRFPDEVSEAWTGYARPNACRYKDFTCLGEPEEKLPTNTRVEVLEELDECYYVRVGENSGFVPAKQLSKYPYKAPSGGQNSSGSDSSTPQDGGDISLMEHIALNLLANVEKTGAANVKTDGVPLVLRLCSLADMVNVLETPPEEAIPGYTAILEDDGTVAYIQTQWLEIAKDFTPWEGYAGSGCKVYTSPVLSGDAVKTLSVNKKLTVLWDTGTAALIQVDNDRYYAASSTLRDRPAAYSSSPEGSSGGNGGSSDMWTPPVL